MNRHYNSTHVFPCKVCKEKFVEKHLMETHYFEEHVMHCPVCKKTFSNKGNLNRHMKQAHGQELPEDYKEPTQKGPLKQGTPTKLKQAGGPKLKSPSFKQGITKVSPMKPTPPRLPLPQFRPNHQQQLPIPHQQQNNLPFSQPTLQQPNFSPQQPRMYAPVMPNNSIVMNWKNEPGISGNGWQQHM